MARVRPLWRCLPIGLLLLGACAVSNTACRVSGAWRSGEDFLFVPRNTSGACAITSNDPRLRGSLRSWQEYSDAFIDIIVVKDSKSDTVAWLFPMLHPGGLDSMEVKVRSGSRRMFVRDTTTGRNLAESMKTYAQGRGSIEFQISDGGIRILHLFYGLTFLLAVVMAFYTDGCGGFFGTMIIIPLGPLSVGLLTGFVHYMVYGWWNARIAGNAFIYTMILLQCLLLIGILIFLIQSVRSFKSSGVEDSGYALKRALFWFLILSDLFSILANIHLVARIIIG
jgi:hypothetical protein